MTLCLAGSLDFESRGTSGILFSFSCARLSNTHNTSLSTTLVQDIFLLLSTTEEKRPSRRPKGASEKKPGYLSSFMLYR